MMRRAVVSFFAVALGLSCTAKGGRDWIEDPSREPRRPLDRRWSGDEPAKAAGKDVPSGELSRIPMDERSSDEDDPLAIRAWGAPSSGVAPIVAPPSDPELFRNTYYDFPREDAGRKDATLFDASCAPIARVTKDFHDRVCVQGSGRLASGATVSFAKRGCGCAAVCPRTSQQICFEALDPARFPNGRGAMGQAITPLHTVAVDSSLIPLGTPVFIPELAGLPRIDGAPHDGCFLAEDRGVRVVGRQVDVFTGDPSVTARWNALFPSNRGVHVRLDEPRCRALANR